MLTFDRHLKLLALSSLKDIAIGGYFQCTIELGSGNCDDANTAMEILADEGMERLYVDGCLITDMTVKLIWSSLAKAAGCLAKPAAILR
jgi:uncharacterized SAM-dependent methyltransferase